MLSNEKIRWMTRAALYEKKEGKRCLRINRFHQGDYISWNVVKSLLGVTVGYMLVIVLYVLYGSETLLDQLTLPYLISLAVRFLFGYLTVLAAAGLISFVVYYSRYQNAHKKNRIYVQYLKKIERIYQKESAASENVKGGPSW